MSKAQLFLFDFVTIKKIKKYLIAIVLFGVAAFYWHDTNPGFTLGTAAMSNIGLTLAFMTTMYSLFSYATMDKIRAYLMLPSKKSEVFFAFVFAQYFALLLENVAFVIVAAILFTKEPVVIILYLLFSSLITVVLDTVFLMGMNRKRYLFPVLSVALIAGLYALLTVSADYVINATVLAAVLVLSICLMMLFKAKHLAINRESKGRNRGLRRGNYFFTVLTREKVILVNTVSILAVTTVFAFISKETPILMSILWGTAAMNTPATTMFSGDRALMRQEKMLPGGSRLMSGVYASFLGVYFAVTNAYVVLLHAVMGRFSFYTALMGISFAVINTLVSILLESRCPITNWQTKQEVWRNPRKYVLPVLVCAVALAPYFLGGGQ
jgi:hypothetical protein